MAATDEVASKEPQLRGLSSSKRAAAALKTLAAGAQDGRLSGALRGRLAIHAAVASKENSQQSAAVALSRTAPSTLPQRTPALALKTLQAAGADGRLAALLHKKLKAISLRPTSAPVRAAKALETLQVAGANGTLAAMLEKKLKARRRPSPEALRPRPHAASPLQAARALQTLQSARANGTLASLLERKLAARRGSDAEAPPADAALS
eukprot:TRINITY_DN25835_c0_g1_i1.p1 TRINITY_DN25835_c0_g1~~TRINITY_DN25835_c0_g1_i1.p1  ORF type:complete len:208 (-),score=55.95 TRINITY_DN25835_c0_g1_i1:189-812(-)